MLKRLLAASEARHRHLQRSGCFTFSEKDFLGSETLVLTVSAIEDADVT